MPRRLRAEPARRGRLEQQPAAWAARLEGRFDHHGVVWCIPRGAWIYRPEGVRTPNREIPGSQIRGRPSRQTTVIRVNVLPNVLPNRAAESVIWLAFNGLTEVSEGGLEPPRPIKGTSTSS
jgi:hypothetical protein